MKLELLPLDQYAHNQIITKAKISVNDLEDDIRVLITDFNKRHNGFKIGKGDPRQDSLATLVAYSNLIGQRIFDYYVDEEDQKTEIQQNEVPTQTEIKEVVKEIKEAIREETNPATDPVVAPGSVIVAAVAEPVTEAEVVEAKPESVEEPEPSGKNEKALFLLFKEGIVKDITIAQLREKGFDTSTWGPISVRGCKVGSYKLSRPSIGHPFTLEKI